MPTIEHFALTAHNALALRSGHEILSEARESRRDV